MEDEWWEGVSEQFHLQSAVMSTEKRTDKSQLVSDDNGDEFLHLCNMCIDSFVTIHPP
jgi:hypothetical protein